MIHIHVSFTIRARNQLLAIRERQSNRRDDALLAAILDIEMITETLTRHGNPPPGSIVQIRPEGTTWWFYADGLWVGFIRDERYLGRWPYRKLTRCFIITRIASRPVRL